MSFPTSTAAWRLWDPPGLGKTHLAIASLRLGCHLRACVDVLRHPPAPATHPTRTYDPVTRRTEDERIWWTASSGRNLLVLDDLGAERATEWVEEMLHLLVNSRATTSGDRRSLPPTTRSRRRRMPSTRKRWSNVLGFRMYFASPRDVRFRRTERPDYREAGPNPSAEKLSRLDTKGSTSHKDLPRPSARVPGARQAANPGGRRRPEVGWRQSRKFPRFPGRTPDRSR